MTRDVELEELLTRAEHALGYASQVLERAIGEAIEDAGMTLELVRRSLDEVHNENERRKRSPDEEPARDVVNYLATDREFHISLLLYVRETVQPPPMNGEQGVAFAKSIEEQFRHEAARHAIKAMLRYTKEQQEKQRKAR